MVIARDRASAYAEGARHGAPGATQVADRFHILQNLAEALTHVFTTYGRALDAVNATAHQQPVLLPNGTSAVPVPPPPTPPAEEARAAQRAARRQVRYDTVWALHRQGWSTTAIAVQVRCSCRTIERYLQMPTWPVRQHRHYGRSIVNPYQVYLLERWNAGCHTAIQLFQEIKRDGYAGSYRRVTAYVSRIRQAQGIHPAARAGASACRWWRSLSALDTPPGDVAGPETRGQAHKPRRSSSSSFTHNRPRWPKRSTLAQDFATLVRQRQRLDPWLTRATASTLEAFRCERAPRGLCSG